MAKLVSKFIAHRSKLKIAKLKKPYLRRSLRNTLPGQIKSKKMLRPGKDTDKLLDNIFMQNNLRIFVKKINFRLRKNLSAKKYKFKNI